MNNKHTESEPVHRSQWVSQFIDIFQRLNKNNLHLLLEQFITLIFILKILCIKSMDWKTYTSTLKNSMPTSSLVILIFTNLSNKVIRLRFIGQ